MGIDIILLPYGSEEKFEMYFYHSQSNNNDIFLHPYSSYHTSKCVKYFIFVYLLRPFPAFITHSE